MLTRFDFKKNQLIFEVETIFESIFLTEFFRGGEKVSFSILEFDNKRVAGIGVKPTNPPTNTMTEEEINYLFEKEIGNV